MTFFFSSRSKVQSKLTALFLFLSCNPQHQSNRSNRPSESGEDFPGFLESTERDIPHDTGGGIGIGKSSMTFPISYAEITMRVRMTRLSAVPTLSSEETAVIGSAESDVIKIEVIDPDSRAILASDLLLQPYEFRQSFTTKSAVDSLGLLVITDPGEPAEKKTLLPNSELGISATGVSSDNSNTLDVSVKMRVTNAVVWLVTYTPDAESIFGFGKDDAIATSGGKTVSPLDTDSTSTEETTGSATSGGTTSDGTGASTAPFPIIAHGAYHGCLVTPETTVKCWGENASGELGNGTKIKSAVPVEVLGLSGVVGIGLANDFSCALHSGGAVSCWGNGTGSFGDGSGTVDGTEPVSVVGITDAIALYAGGFHACVLRRNKTVKCWGGNTFGQLGNGSYDPTTSVSNVSGLSDVTEVALGLLHSCALKSDGTVRCWGSNVVGSLGDGCFTVKCNTPVTVNGLNSAVSIASGYGNQSTCVMFSGGAAKCWGSGQNGELGDDGAGTGVSGLANARKIYGGANSYCAVMNDGALNCWGNNGGGKLGDGSTTTRWTFVPVEGIANAHSAALGGESSCALLDDKSVKCWGTNQHLQLGNPSTSFVSYYPVTVNDF